MQWSAGRHLDHLRLMGLRPAAFVAAPAVEGLAVREAGPGDLEVVVALDAEAFGGEPRRARPWSRRASALPASPSRSPSSAASRPPPRTRPHGRRRRTGVLLAGVAVAGPLRRRGIGAAISSWLLAGGFAAGARLGHLQADTDGAARVYARLGFGEAGALAVFEDV